jgi:hypothetical protein
MGGRRAAHADWPRTLHVQEDGDAVGHGSFSVYPYV